MDEARRTPLAYRAAWSAIAVVLVLAFAVWGARIAVSFETAVPRAATPIPRATVLPGIRDGQHELRAVQRGDPVLADFATRKCRSSIESATGAVVSTVHC